MKRLLLTCVAMTGLVASTVFADVSTDKNAGYFSKQHPLLVATAKKAMYAPTDITLINASSRPIYAIVPGSSINDIIYSGQQDEIRNYNGAFYTPIVLQDAYRRQINSFTVCPLAVVTVFDQVGGGYRVVVNGTYCN